MRFLKLALEIKFLNKCKLYGKIPLFISHNVQKYSYRTLLIQSQILQKEIKHKERLSFNFNDEKRLLNNKLFQYFNQICTFQNWNLILSNFLKKMEDSINIFIVKT